MKERFSPVLAVIFTCAFVAMSAAMASAQTSRGTVSGTVMDQSSAVVSGAEVELKNTATNTSRTTATNDSGIYRFDAVDLGVYDLTIRAKGFKTITNTGVQVQANRNAAIDAQLEVGNTELVVDVSAAAGELLQTSEPVRGGNFSQAQVTQLPSSGANPYDLGRLLPGVVTASGVAQFGNSAQFSINGSRPRGNNYLLDGTENNDISVTGPANVVQNEDAIAEVSVQTGLFSAEFGRAGGGVFNIITKSGANDYHGTVKWLILSEVFNALTNNDVLSGLKKPAVFTENVFGGSIGGPLPLPRFGEGGPSTISGKDRNFFFFGLQYDRYRSTSNFGPFRVPTVAGVQTLQTLFPTGTNPRLDLYLAAIGNQRGVTSLTNISLSGTGVTRPAVETGLIGVTAPQIYNDRQWVLRTDHRVNDKHQLSFRYTTDASLQTLSSIAVNPDFTTDFTGVSTNFLATHTWLINSSLTNELRVSPYGLINFQFPFASTTSPLAKTLQNIAISGLSTVGIATNLPQGRRAKNFLFQDTMTKIYNSHTFRFGVEFLKQTARQRPPFNERGSFSFTNQGGGFTALANFLDNFSGPTGSANINFGFPFYTPNLFRKSAFVQDTWKTTPNLTLTIGTRYENFGQPANAAFKFPAFAGFDPAQFLVPNKVNPDNNNFGPIIGLAYAPSGHWPLSFLLPANKSVIRTGYQVSYDTFFNNLLSNIAADSPNNLSTTNQAPSTGRGTAGFFPTAIPSAPAPATPLNQQTSVFNKDIRNPYTQRWSLGFQRELPGNFLMDLSYVGSAGRKLFVTEDLNPINIATGVRFYPLLGIRRYRTSGANSNYHSMQLRVDKRLSRGLMVNTSYTWSKNMDQISEVFTTTQTQSSLASIPAFQGGLALDYAPSDYHRGHRLVINYIWDIPGLKHGIGEQVLGGWRLAGITTLQSGAPFTIANGLDRNGDGLLGQDRPDLGNPNAPHNTRATRVASSVCPSLLRSPDTLNCVTANDVYVIQAASNSGINSSMLGRNTERSNKVANFDLSVFKDFRVRENLRLQYSLIMFNVFNHPQFTGIPSASVTSSLQNRFLDYTQLNGGGRDMRMSLKIKF